MKRVSINNIFIFTTILLAISSCGQNFNEVKTSPSRNDVSSDFENSGEGMVYLVNPIVATGNSNLSFTNYGDKIKRVKITDEAFLISKFSMEQAISLTETVQRNEEENLFIIRNDNTEDSRLLQSLNGSWNFNRVSQSDEFYQVGTFFHINDMTQSVFDAIRFAHSFLHFENSISVPPSIPSNYIDTKGMWFQEEGQTKTLSVYSKCKVDEFNAFFDPTDNSICYGVTEDNPDLLMSQDPSVIYHELGHAFVKIMMNQRNIKSSFPNGITTKLFQSNLGELFYDEAGSINEGICDYFSYFMNGRERIGEWSMGRFFGASRPMSERDKIYDEINALPQGEKLSYPSYVNFDTNDTSKPFEDVHMAGQIVSHYLVALTNRFKNRCDPKELNLSSAANNALNSQLERFANRWSNIYDPNDKFLEDNTKKHVFASSLVLMLLSDTLAEIGDLFANGSDFLDPDMTNDNSLNEIFFTNLNEDESFLWTQTVNPPNFRRFFKIFAQKIKSQISEGACPAFSLDESEQLLDEYGLLLFKSYEENKKSSNGEKVLSDFNNLQVLNNILISPGVSSSVNELNRRNTILVSKDFIDIPATGTKAFVFDTPSTVQSLLKNLTFEGKVPTTTADVAGVEYNNGNANISPGEVVGLALNIKNNSNSTIGGLQVLANDWDHLKLSDNNIRNVNRNNIETNTIASYNPCIFDGWPLEAEGGVLEDNSDTEGNCSFVTRDNKIIDNSGETPKYELDSPQPICLVQFSGENETSWKTQDFFRRVELDIDDSSCLNYPQMSGEEFNPNECLVRFLPGAQQAYFSRLNSQKTWGETMSDGNSSPVFNSSAALIMEVNKEVPPGTVFTCRFRARFSNCSDCFSDGLSGDEYSDFEYAGPKAYKIINFQFTVRP